MFPENEGNPFLGAKSLLKEVAFGDENEYNLSYGKWGFEYFLI